MHIIFNNYYSKNVIRFEYEKNMIASLCSNTLLISSGSNKCSLWSFLAKCRRDVLR